MPEFLRSHSVWELEIQLGAWVQNTRCSLRQTFMPLTSGRTNRQWIIPYPLVMREIEGKWCFDFACSRTFLAHSKGCLFNMYSTSWQARVFTSHWWCQRLREYVINQMWIWFKRCGFDLKDGEKIKYLGYSDFFSLISMRVTLIALHLSATMIVYGSCK